MYALLFFIVLLGFLVTILDKEIFWLLKIHNVSATFKETFLIDHIVKPELDCLLFLLNGKENSVLIESLTWVVCLRSEIRDIIVQ